MRVGNLRELQSLACIPFLGILASLQLIDPSVANIALVKASDCNSLKLPIFTGFSRVLHQGSANGLRGWALLPVSV